MRKITRIGTRAVLTGFITLLLTAVAVPATADAAEPARSRRSADAAKRVTPTLQQALAQKKLPWGAPVFIRVFKDERVLEVWMQGGEGTFQLFKSYPICTYSGSLGPKLKVGDRQAPEGFYRVTATQMNPYSQYHLSFDLGYPNAYDRAHGRTGSALMVHGNCVSIGCYAMGDAAIEEIYTLADAALRHGQTAFEVQALPFRLTEQALVRHQKERDYEFWRTLKAGYDAFEKTHQPPKISIQKKQYVVQ